ncbi:MAG: Site-determining protein [Candidatus Gottesmanbacteria bacterium GW2011_GWC2_39_8]|uniref:Site-determining protein n=1 Tax=Candidatus Gottesmanbacteria bacterium GW2011_GWC2_39_8 TaxID=1618450 RepID=A0A0G0PSR9_9BACT|nr:MAG: Site-determining protein [Candidatus Gottesmanbacteria bacterium GW2011_GWC2_39_8]
MQEKKKLGRGIEEISHHFISSETKEKIEKSEKRRSISICTSGSTMQKDFLISNLSSEIAAKKKRVVIFNQDIQQQEISLFPKSLKHEFSEEDGNKFYRVNGLPEGFGDILIVTSNNGYSDGEKDKNITVLDNIEKQWGRVDIIFVNTPSELIAKDERWVRAYRENIIITSPEEKEMMRNYSIIKKICEINPYSLIGLVVNKVNKVSEAVRAFNKMAEITSKYLSKQLLSFGFFYDDLIIIRSILEGSALVLSYPDTKLQKCLRGISEIIVNEENNLPYNNNSNSFFDKTTISPFRTGIVENNLSLEEALEFGPSKGEERQF